MNKYTFDFHLFSGEDAHQIYPDADFNLNPNWTGQRNGVGTYTQTNWANYSGNDISAEMKTFYDKALIRLAEPNLIHDQFGQKRPIPAGNGKTIEFRRFNPLPAVKGDRALVEGITPTGQNYGVANTTATVNQYGGYITTTDMLNLAAFDNTMAEILKLLGSQAGRISDIVTRDELVTYGANVMYAGSANGRKDDTNITGLTAADLITIEDIKKAVRFLRRNNAETINGDYVAIVHPDIAYDLMNDSEWIDANQYAGSKRIFEGEIGKMYGVRFVESTQAKIWKDSSCPSITGGYLPVYATLVLGANAYGVTSIGGGGIATIVKQLGSGGTADPLNQRATVGWKLNKAAKVLVDAYMVRIESASSYGSLAEGN